MLVLLLSPLRVMPARYGQGKAADIVLKQTFPYSQTPSIRTPLHARHVSSVNLEALLHSPGVATEDGHVVLPLGPLGECAESAVGREGEALGAMDVLHCCPAASHQ